VLEVDFKLPLPLLMAMGVVGDEESAVALVAVVVVVGTRPEDVLNFFIQFSFLSLICQFSSYNYIS
jgi:hypothetical protein